MLPRNSCTQLQYFSQVLLWVLNWCFACEWLTLFPSVPCGSAFYLSLLSYSWFLQWHLPVESIPKQQLSQWCLFRKRIKGFKTAFAPWWLKICLQCRRPGFDPWVWKIPWRRKWQSTPILWPGTSHGQRSLVGYSWWGHKSGTWLSD